LRRIAAVAAATFRESVRERVLYNLVIFALLMIVSGLLLKPLSIRQDAKIIQDLGLAAIDFFGTLIAIFIGVGLVSKEIERRSLYPLLAKPLRRSEFLIGRFLGLALTLLVNTGAITAGLFLTLVATGNPAPAGLLLAVAPLYLSLLVVVALALLLSSVGSSAMAAISTVSVVLAGRFSDVIRNMKEVVPDAPGPLIDLVYYLLPNFRNFDFKDRVVYGELPPASDLLASAAYGACYIVVALAIALGAFERRDL